MTTPSIQWGIREASWQRFCAQGAAFFLGACSPSAPKAAPPAALPEDVLSQGQGIYEQLCATCHFDGHGSPTAPSLVDSAIIKGPPVEVIRTILRGRSGHFKVNGVIPAVGMPPQNTLSDEDIAAVVTYVRHQFGQQDQLVTPQEVAAQR